MGANPRCTQIGPHPQAEQDHPIPEIDKWHQGRTQDLQDDTLPNNLPALLRVHVVAHRQQDGDVGVALGPNDPRSLL